LSHYTKLTVEEGVMSMKVLQDEIVALEQVILEKKKQLAELRKSLPKQPINNYQFLNSNNKTVSILELFEDKDELIIVQNMGKSCPYCTMWADGFNGVYHHLVDKAAFVVASPDSPEEQDAFAAERRWQFPMISTQGTTFKEDFGFVKEGNQYPGVTTFQKDAAGNITHIADAPFGPGDDFCAVWHLFDLLPSGSESYHPKRKINKKTDFQLTNNIALQINNYQDAIKFYEKTIGMTVAGTFDNETKFTFGGTNFYVENSDANNVYFEFAVGNFENAKAKLLEAGCQVTKEYHEKSIMVADPYGLKFHLFEGTK
jgi:predicted dithiol-disulfide oxidoreductase (DUF899 family)/predicted enzyme related to lactoylglutathione lyase